MDSETHSRLEELLGELRSLRNEENRRGMARFGINADRALGIPMRVLRPMARAFRREHQLALALWETGIHEARLLAILSADPKQATVEELEQWLTDLDSWDLCDQFCSNLVRRTPFALVLIPDWCAREPEFERRAGFALICSVSVHHKMVPDEQFLAFFPLILSAATDSRNYVTKAVNWAIRQIGKRNPLLHAAALDLCEQLLEIDHPAARWIARDAARELTDPRTVSRIRSRSH